jgi:hypothetical protein
MRKQRFRVLSALFCACGAPFSSQSLDDALSCPYYVVVTTRVTICSMRMRRRGAASWFRRIVHPRPRSACQLVTRCRCASSTPRSASRGRRRGSSAPACGDRAGAGAAGRGRRRAAQCTAVRRIAVRGTRSAAPRRRATEADRRMTQRRPHADG